jgi:bifunctional DNA-binding transcriptional regulator/antitoxin component of YhaV-PrlF toxin-antitoxin module
MRSTKPCVAKIQQGGIITIPNSIREACHLEEGQTVTISSPGNSIMTLPSRLEQDKSPSIGHLIAA